MWLHRNINSAYVIWSSMDSMSVSPTTWFKIYQYTQCFEAVKTYLKRSLKRDSNPKQGIFSLLGDLRLCVLLSIHSKRWRTGQEFIGQYPQWPPINGFIMTSWASPDHLRGHVFNRPTKWVGSCILYTHENIRGNKINSTTNVNFGFTHTPMCVSTLCSEPSRALWKQITRTLLGWGSNPWPLQFKSSVLPTTSPRSPGG